MAINKNKIIKVTNRDNGKVGYVIEDLGNLHRSFNAGETKEITFEELEKLSWVDGGMYILKNCLLIDDPEATKQLFNESVDPQYYYTEEDIKKLLLGTGVDNMNRFLDALDFAPDGVKDIIKKLAVTLPCNDVAKREAILDKLHFDVSGALMLQEASESKAEEPTRRVAAPEVKQVRRYKVVENQ